MNKDDLGYYLLKIECPECKCGNYAYLETEDNTGLIVLHDMKQAKKTRAEVQKQIEETVIIHRLATKIHDLARSPGVNN